MGILDLPNFLKKLDSYSAWGALTTFPCKFGGQIFFFSLGVHVHPVHPLATTMQVDLNSLVTELELFVKCNGVHQRAN